MVTETYQIVGANKLYPYNEVLLRSNDNGYYIVHKKHITPVGKNYRTTVDYLPKNQMWGSVRCDELCKLGKILYEFHPDGGGTTTCPNSHFKSVLKEMEIL